MRPPETRNPAGGPGNAGQHLGRGLPADCNPFTVAAAKALNREIWIVVQAAHIVASGRSLSWDDCERVHTAHQHIIRVLAASLGREVMT